MVACAKSSALGQAQLIVSESILPASEKGHLFAWLQSERKRTMSTATAAGAQTFGSSSERRL
jgi:hypothetical protein